jgi:hypothetical protein
MFENQNQELMVTEERARAWAMPAATKWCA